MHPGTSLHRCPVATSPRRRPAATSPRQVATTPHRPTTTATTTITLLTTCKPNFCCSFFDKQCYSLLCAGSAPRRPATTSSCRHPATMSPRPAVTSSCRLATMAPSKASTGESSSNYLCICVHRSLCLFFSIEHASCNQPTSPSSRHQSTSAPGHHEPTPCSHDPAPSAHYGAQHSEHM